MELCGGAEERERGGRPVPRRVHQQKRAETAALSTVQTIKDLERSFGGGEVPKNPHFKGPRLSLQIWGTTIYWRLCGNAAQLRNSRA